MSLLLETCYGKSVSRYRWTSAYLAADAHELLAIVYSKLDSRVTTCRKTSCGLYNIETKLRGEG
jgi:hypothetical protein